MSEADLRRAIVQWGRSLFERGLTAGSSGNISVKLDDGFLVTPTNSCLGFLDADRLSKLDPSGALVSGDPPTKELPLHFSFYEVRPTAKAVVHLHSTHATALSCLADVDPEDAIPPITPYVVMRVGRVPVVPYTRPGAPDVAPLIRAKAGEHPAILLGNHGPVVAGTSLEGAVFAMEELEETARLVLLTRGMKVRLLSPEAIADLNATFRLK
jgi:ribulose-5-phosphate 4-epimerase/fuculose-1-phosphate aldolase